jgi:hypothetical protein
MNLPMGDLRLQTYCHKFCKMAYSDTNTMCLIYKSIFTCIIICRTLETQNVASLPLQYNCARAEVILSSLTCQSLYSRSARLGCRCKRLPNYTSFPLHSNEAQLRVTTKPPKVLYMLPINVMLIFNHIT